MPAAITIRTASGATLCTLCVVADTPLRRLRGLLGRRALAAGEGLLLRPASSIHTCGMRFAIDAVFLDEAGRITRIAARLRPWRVATSGPACQVLELPGGACGALGIAVGDRLSITHRGRCGPAGR